MDKGKRLIQVSWWELLTVGESGSFVMGRATLSKPSIQFSVDRQGCVPSLLFGLRPNYVGIMTVMVISFKRTFTYTVVFCAPDPTAGCCWPMPSPETPGHSQASLAQSLVGTLLLSPGSWCTQGFVCALQESVSPVLWKFCNQIPLACKAGYRHPGMQSQVGLRQHHCKQS